MPADSKKDVGYEGPLYDIYVLGREDDDDEGDEGEDMNLDPDQDQSQVSPGVTPGSPRSGEPARSQAQISEDETEAE